MTGEVVGAFDEVHEGGDGSRMDKKKEKILKIAKRGGAEIRYGLKLENGKLARAGLTGIPVFYLGLDSAALTELIQGLATRDEKKMDQAFETLRASLDGQRAELEKNGGAPGSEFRRRLASFGKSLARLAQ